MNKVMKTNIANGNRCIKQALFWGLLLAYSLGFCGCGSEGQSLDEMLMQEQVLTSAKALDAGQQAQRESSKKEERDNMEGSIVEAEDEEQTLWVHICGYVQTPGIYELPVDCRVYDCLMAAGGFADGADESALNLAGYLKDGSQIYVPGLNSVLDGTAGTRIYGQESENERDQRIDINTATKEQLETLPGIGESRARDIIAYRESQGQFKTIEDIQKISGIKTAIYEKIKDLITVGN